MGLLGVNSTIPFYNSANSVADIVARSHYQRVIDDGGVIDDYQALLDAINGLFNAYATNNLPVFLAAAIDPAIFGYKVGAGSGTTLGRAASKLYSLMGASSDVVQSTAAAQPLLLRWNATDGNYWFSGDRIANNYLSQPDSVAVQESDEFSLTYYGSLFETGTQTLAAKIQNVNNYSYWLRYKSGFIDLIIYPDGVTNVNYSIALPFDVSIDAYHVTYTIDNGTGNSEAVFYTRKNGVWTNNGTATQAIQPQVFKGNSELSIGSVVNGVGDIISKVKTYRVIYQDAILLPSVETNLIWEFNPNTYDISVSQNTLADPVSGQLWTINRSTATTGYKAQITTRSTIQSDGVDDRLTTGTLTTTIPQPTSKYFFMEQLSWTSNDYLAAFSAMSIFQTSLSPNIQAFTGGGAIDFIGEQLNRIQALTNVQDGASSLNQVNNGAETTGTQGAVAINQINLLSDQTARFGNFVLNTCIISRQNDNATTRTAVYNLARGWNGNPA
jgi:hypothetical protein